MATQEFTPPVHTMDKNKSEKVYFVLDEFKGNNLASFRVWFTKDGGATFFPSSKGISVRVEQLPELIEGMKVLAAEAGKRGFLTWDEQNLVWVAPDTEKDPAA